MPQIPEFNNDTDIRPGQGAGISPGALAAPGEAVARAGAEEGSVLDEFNQRYQNARRAADHSNYMAGYSAQLNDLSHKWGLVPDRQQALDGFNADVATIRKTIGKISDPLLQQTVTASFNAEASARQLETGQRAFGMESSKRAGDLDTNLAAFAQSAAGAADPMLKAKIFDDGVAAIHGAVAGSWITPQEGAQRELHFHSQMQEVDVRQQMGGVVQSQDPDAALKLLNKLNDPSQFPGLEADTRARLTDRGDGYVSRLQNRAIAQQAHEDAVGERLLRQGQSHNEATMLSQIFAGKSFDNEQLEDMASGQQISPEGLEAIHRAQNERAEGNDDAQTVTHLWNAIDNHQAQPSDIYAAMSAGKVKGSTGAEMMRTVDRGVQSGAEKNALDTLDTIIKGQSKGVLGSLDGSTAATLGQARLEFGKRVNNGENPQAVMKDVLKEYVGSALVPNKLAAPKLGTVNNLADLNKIVTATVKAHQAHQLSDAEYDQQVSLLGQYRHFLNTQALIGSSTAATPSTNAAPGGQQAKQ